MELTIFSTIPAFCSFIVKKYLFEQEHALILFSIVDPGSQNDMGAEGPRCDLSLPFTLPPFQAIKDMLHYVKCNAGPVSQIALMPKSHNHDWELAI